MKKSMSIAGGAVLLLACVTLPAPASGVESVHALTASPAADRALLAASPESAVADRGFSEVGGLQLARIVKDLGFPVANVRCYSASVSQSHPRWGQFWTSAWASEHSAKCKPWDGLVVIKRSASGWVDTGVGGSSDFCMAEVTQALAKAGASYAVQVDFLTHWGC
jgi:hypothetical protein